MTFLRVLATEWLKLRRTIGLKMVVLAPATVVLLVLFLVSQAPFSMLRGSDDWMGLWRLIALFWALLMMPVYLALESALVAGVDHSENQWKSLLARPVARWNFYVAKLTMLVGMLVSASAILFGGSLLDAILLPHLNPRIAFAGAMPWQAMARECAQLAGLGLLALAIQHWVSLRWRSFGVAIAFGLVAMVVGYFAVVATNASGGLPEYFPWALPMLVLQRNASNVNLVLLGGCVVALLVVALGCRDFGRREIA
jgi:lantibiotic transport system permease protein